MTLPEYANDAYEQPTPRWEQVDTYIQNRIESTAVAIEFADEQVVAQKVTELNKFLKNEGNMNISARVQTRLPLFLGKKLTESGVEDYPVIDKDYLSRNTFEGVLMGCVSARLESDDMNLLFYDVKISDDYNGLHLQAPVDGSSIEISYPTDDSWEEDVRGAFAVLETIEDETYREVVEELERIFWDTNQPLVERLQMIGVYTIELLAHDATIGSDEFVKALGVIIGESIEKDLHYRAKGCAAHEVRTENGTLIVDAINQTEFRILQPVGVRYISNFEILSSSGGGMELKLGDTLQPAFVFFDIKERTEVDYPLRYLAAIEEVEYSGASQQQTTEPQYLNRLAGLTNGKTCGEIYREYWQNHNDGV